jgi:hypothetical protein
MKHPENEQDKNEHLKQAPFRAGDLVWAKHELDGGGVMALLSTARYALIPTGSPVIVLGTVHSGHITVLTSAGKGRVFASNVVGSCPQDKNDRLCRSPGFQAGSCPWEHQK